MADPTTATNVPHLVGVLLDSNGVALTQVIALNRTTGERLVKETDSSKRAMFNLAEFTSGYSNGDVIEFNNTGGSLGGNTVTVDSTSGNFQNSTITCTAMISTALSM